MDTEKNVWKGVLYTLAGQMARTMDKGNQSRVALTISHIWYLPCG